MGEKDVFYRCSGLLGGLWVGGVGVVVVCGQGFVFVGEEEAAFVNQYEEEDGKSFAVFFPLGNERASC